MKRKIQVLQNLREKKGMKTQEIISPRKKRQNNSRLVSKIEELERSFLVKKYLVKNYEKDNVLS